MRKKLDTYDDGYPNTHFTKVVTDEHSDTLYSSVERRGHPLVYFLEGGGCESQLRILRAALPITLYYEAS